MSHKSKYNKSKYNNLNNQSIYPASEPTQIGFDEIDRIDVKQNENDRETYSAIIKENISYELLLEKNTLEAEAISEIFSIMVDVVCSTQNTIRVNGGDMPRETVKSVFLKLNGEHVEYALECLKKTTTKRANIRAYIITTLYNTLSTISNYYSAEVNYDLYGG